MHKSTIYLAIIAFAIGIAWQSIFEQSVTFVAFLFVLSFIIWLFLYKVGHKSRLIIFLLTMFALGSLRMYITQSIDYRQASSLSNNADTYIEFKGPIVSEPDKREYYTAITVESEGSKVLIKAGAHTDLQYGDIVRVNGKLEKIQNFIGDTGREFNYVDYLAKDDIYYQVKRAKVDVLSHKRNRGVRYWLFNIKSKYLQTLSSYIPEPESALAGGITVGSKNSLGKELLEDFRKTGVVHIVVLSGFNVAIIVIFLTYIFSFAGLKLGRALSAIGIILFAMLTGGGATVVRASTMGLLALLALTVRRKYAVLRALFIVGLFMLLYNPKILLSDISFQLSFVATMGMILIMPIVERYLVALPNTLKFREIVSATVATQIAVSPLLLYYMGELSVVALVANVLVLPLVTIAMLMVFLTGLIGLFSNVIVLPFAYVAYALLHSIVKIVEYLASLPYITIGVTHYGLPHLVFSYVVIALVVLLLKSPSDDAPVYIR